MRVRVPSLPFLVKIITDQITIKELKEMSKKMFGNLVKAVVDIEKGMMAIDGELHADLAELLAESGSRHENMWGINIYPELENEEWLEFDSMINLKPLLGNRTRSVDNPEVKEKIISIIDRLIKR
ncbi:MAG: hypothetical protein G01um10142_194 [Parcubacteria group bacterium Gr01-1014_2]|nr:MAG: hypothetical protein G01um10142_194 [Parcubacteria group bacterium Gr01-1014_2]